MELQEKLEQDVFNWLSSNEFSVGWIEEVISTKSDPAAELRDYVEFLVMLDDYSACLKTDWLLTIISWLDWSKLADRFMPDKPRNSRIDCIVVNYDSTGKGQTIEVWRDRQHRTYQYTVGRSLRFSGKWQTWIELLPQYTLDATSVLVLWR